MTLTPSQAAALTPERIELMRHATAWPKQYRNYYAVSRGAKEFDEWMTIADVGLATYRPREGVVFPDDYFHVTPTGLAALRDYEQEASSETK